LAAERWPVKASWAMTPASWDFGERWTARALWIRVDVSAEDRRCRHNPPERAALSSGIAGSRRLLAAVVMGVVYRATDARLGRQVAMKVLPSECGDDQAFRSRFLRESRLAASIDHQGVTPIYEAGEAGGRLFIAMRHVDGIDRPRRAAASRAAA
jgi:hypothetical protein